jgi:hypothetical protein
MACPNCGSTIPTDLWQEWMDADYMEGGFVLPKHRAPCCHYEVNLNELLYEFPQGLAKFSIKIMNPSAEEPVEQVKSALEEVLGTVLRVIYRRI